MGNRLLLLWKILAIGLFILSVSSFFFDNYKWGFIFLICYNYIMFEVITTHVEEGGKN